MKIAYLANRDSANGFYRGVGPMTNLVHRGHEVRSLWGNESGPPVGAVRGVDALHIHRFYEQEALVLAREAKAHGAAVVWDDDDDLGALPKGSTAHRNHGGIRWERRLAGMRRMFELADLVTTPSAVLAGRLREHGAPRVEVVENFVPEHFRAATRRPRTGLTIGWVAAKEHRLEVEQLGIRDALARLLEARPEVRVMTVGVGLGLRSDRYVHVKGASLLELPERIAAFDIGIAPLVDSRFNRGRSNVKLKEYAAAGAMWLASGVGPYVGMGEAQGGALVADGEWADALTLHVVDYKRRSALMGRARAWARHDSMQQAGVVWEKAFRGAIHRARAHRSVMSG
jgi:glycosyltransferase involved in cell wall biosynthesis